MSREAISAALFVLHPTPFCSQRTNRISANQRGPSLNNAFASCGQIQRRRDEFCAQFHPITASASETVHVSRDGEGQLTLKMPYLPLYQLRSYQSATFSIVHLDDFRVEFRRGPTGTVDALVHHQLSGTFIARRAKIKAARRAD